MSETPPQERQPETGKGPPKDQPTKSGISPEDQAVERKALAAREAVSRLQEEHLRDFLVRMKSTDEKERTRTREELAQIPDIEKLRTANVTVQKNNGDHHLKHLKLAASFLESAEPPLNQNGHMEFLVNFHGNENAEWKVGAGHCLPPEVSVIAVFDEHGDPVTKKAIRMIKDGRIGYFDEKTGEYAHIHTGFRIEILETGGSTEEKVATRILKEKEFFEKDAKKSILKEGLANFFRMKGVEVTIDDLYFEQKFDEIFEEANRAAPDWWKTYCENGRVELPDIFEKFFGIEAQNLIANFNLAGVKDLTLSDLPDLLKNEELKPLQKEKFTKKEDLPFDVDEYLVPREVQSDEGFEKVTDNSNPPKEVMLRATAARMFKRALRIAASLGVQLCIPSSYRDFHDQERVVKRSIEKRGSHDHRFVATPGHSPHHTGGAIDVHAFRNGKEDQSLLWQILPQCGFENYHAEDWHWEFGTERWKRQYASARGAVYEKVLDRRDIIMAA